MPTSYLLWLQAAALLLTSTGTGTPVGHAVESPCGHQHSNLRERQDPVAFQIPGAPARDDLHAWTGFLKYENCDDNKKKALINAMSDSVMLAKVVETASRENPNPSDRIDWNSAAAVEYFGPPSKNKDYRDSILSVYKKASLSEPGWGWSDWWNYRYVNIKCDPKDETPDCYNHGKKDVAAFTTPTTSTDKKVYDDLTFCNAYFNVLKPHAELWKAVKADKSKQDNVSNLRSQATTFFHELLHLRKGDAKVCDECKDQRFYIGPSNDRVKVTAYKPGRIKLLAKTSPNGAFLASRNNDNYPYFAMAMLMQNEFKNYPAFPQAWNPDRKPGDQDSKAKEDDSLEGYPQKPDFQADATYTGVYKDSDYPAAYISTYGSVQPAGPSKPPTSPGDGLPNPKCVDHPSPDEHAVGQPEAWAQIQKFCSNKAYWDTTIVPLVSFGTGRTNAGGGKALGADDPFPVNGGADKLWLGISFSEDNCVGNFKFAQGKTDAEKIKHCTDRFGKILNGCNTDTIKKKYGGQLDDTCAVYRMTTRSKDNSNPLTLKSQTDPGSFVCAETDTSAIGGKSSPLAGTCQCHYSNIPGVTDVFKKPSSGNCKDTNKADLVTN